MKRIRLRIAAAALVLGIASPAAAAGLPATKLKVIGTWSNLSQFKNYEQPFWTETLARESGGAVTASAQGFNELGLKGNEVVRLMEQGVIDMGATVLGYLAADDPRNEAIDLAGLSPDAATARKVTEAYKPALAELYARDYDITLLGIWPYSAQVLFCNTPVAGLKDLAGRKVRTGNRTLAEFVGALGGTGVTLSFSEVVPALQKGVVDCAITGSLSGYSAKWHEVATHLHALPVGWSQVMLAASAKAWNQLDPKVRAFVEQQIAGLEDRIWEAAAYESAQGIACNTGGACEFGKPAAMTLVPVSDADRATLAAVLKEVVVPKWAERCGKPCAEEWARTAGAAAGYAAD